METSQDYIKKWYCAGGNHSLPDALHIACCVHGYLWICLYNICSQGKKEYLWEGVLISSCPWLKDTVLIHCPSK